jgi:hypothetical protein
MWQLSFTFKYRKNNTICESSVSLPATLLKVAKVMSKFSLSVRPVLMMPNSLSWIGTLLFAYPVLEIEMAVKTNILISASLLENVALQKDYNVVMVVNISQKWSPCVAGNYGNQAFPEIPRQFRKCLEFPQLPRHFQKCLGSCRKRI